MKQLFLFFIPLILISCGTDLTDFSGFWVEKEYEDDRVIIIKNGNNYLVENQGKKYPAIIKDGLLEVSTELPMKATIDENDILIMDGNEYIRIKKSKTYKIAKFNDCSFGDLMHISFDGIDEDFGDANYHNNYGEYELCIEDSEGYIISNPEYVGKEFIIKWDMKKIEVSDPIEPWKTSWEKRPRITYLKMNE